jgi:hypothetical protein
MSDKPPPKSEISLCLSEATIRKSRIVRRAGPTCKDYLQVPPRAPILEIIP